MRKLSKRDKKTVVVGSIVVLSIVLVVYVILPFYSAQSEVVDDLANKQRLLQRAIQTMQEQDQYREQLGRLDAELSRYNDRLLDSRNASNELMEILSSLERQYNVKISRTSQLEDRKVGDHYAKVTLQVNLEGNTTDLANFLYGIASHPKYLVVEDPYVVAFQMRNQLRIQPRINVSGFVRLS